MVCNKPDRCTCFSDEAKTCAWNTSARFNDAPNPKQAYGDLKPNVALNPGSAAAYQALAHEDGASKYGPFNWREKSIELMTYVAAAKRHLDAWVDGEDYSVDTVEAGAPVHNLGHVLASIAILIDAMETPGCAIDNRPKAGGSSKLHERVKAERKTAEPAKKLCSCADRCFLGESCRAELARGYVCKKATDTSGQS